MEKTLKQINDVLETQVRPYLAKHQGNISISNLEEGVLTLRLQGQCAQCASASDTLHYVIEKPLMEHFPQIHTIELDTSLSDDMIALAKSVLSGKSPFNEREI